MMSVMNVMERDRERWGRGGLIDCDENKKVTMPPDDETTTPRFSNTRTDEDAIIRRAESTHFASRQRRVTLCLMLLTQAVTKGTHPDTLDGDDDFKNYVV